MAAVSFTSGNSEVSRIKIVRVVSVIIAFLIAIDGFVGWVANRSLSNEESERISLIVAAANNGEKEILVNHLTTIPARLTFILDPAQDQVFVERFSKHEGLIKGGLNESAISPKPRTVNSLKKIKNLL